jgi:hypothetical protein
MELISTVVCQANCQVASWNKKKDASLQARQVLLDEAEQRRHAGCQNAIVMQSRGIGFTTPAQALQQAVLLAPTTNSWRHPHCKVQ